MCIIYKYYIRTGDKKMKKILYVDACTRPDSRTKVLAEHLLSYLEGDVTHLRLFSEAISPLNEKAIRERQTSVKQGRFEGNGLEYAKQFSEADIIVIAAPVWNLCFPSMLQVYCENIAVEGITYSLDENGTQIGLCRAQKFYYVTATGTRNLDPVFGYGYLKTLFSMLGIHSSACFSAEALDIPGADDDMILTICKREIDASFNFPSRDTVQFEPIRSTK